MQAVSRTSTTGRLFRYVCASYWNRGASVCANGRMANMETADGAIRELLASEVLQPSVIERALDRAVAMLRSILPRQGVENDGNRAPAGRRVGEIRQFGVDRREPSCELRAPRGASFGLFRTGSGVLACVEVSAARPSSLRNIRCLRCSSRPCRRTPRTPEAPARPKLLRLIISR
jgi:hypothetical protein